MPNSVQLSETEPDWTDGIGEQYGHARYGDSPYYSPERFGLETLAEADVAGSYEFDTVLVWRDPQTRELFGAWDSGCSCPTPFSGLTREGMRPIRELADLNPLIERLHAPEHPAVHALREKVRRALWRALWEAARV